jgi:hypothetical protein
MNIYRNFFGLTKDFVVAKISTSRKSTTTKARVKNENKNRKADSIKKKNIRQHQVMSKLQCSSFHGDDD